MMVVRCVVGRCVMCVVTVTCFMVWVDGKSADVVIVVMLEVGVGVTGLQ